MTTPAFLSLLQIAQDTHAAIPALGAFCAFPTDLAVGDWQPFDVPAARLMAAETGWGSPLHPLAKAFVAAGPDAQWRETYKETPIGGFFLDRFACYCLIGPGGPWSSAQMYGYVVYMPPGLWYPWHQHPAEELYVVLAGEAEFLRDGDGPEILRAGDSSFHASDQPHAMRTYEHPVMAYVVWSNHFETPPVLTPGRALKPPT